MTARSETAQQQGGSIELLVGWLDALRRRDREAATVMLDPSVAWQGLRPDLVCRGADEVVDIFLDRPERRLEVEAVELIAAPRGVVFAARPTAGEVTGIEPRGAIYQLLTLEHGRITRIQEYPGREGAFAAAGLTANPIDEDGDNRARARRAIERVCSGREVDLAPELYREDFVDHVNDMTFEGLAGVRESVGMYRAIFPDLRFEVNDQVSEGDRVASRWTLRGTYRGRTVALQGITISRFAGSRIVEDWGRSDTLSLVRQLGLLRSVALGIAWVTGRLKTPADAG